CDSSGCATVSSYCAFFGFYVLRRPPNSPLFPYTTLFRSGRQPPDAARRRVGGGADGDGDQLGHRQRGLAGDVHGVAPQRPRPDRSEEHTSELQSLRHLVCRLLLEKKKRDKSTPRFAINSL